MDKSNNIKENNLLNCDKVSVCDKIGMCDKCDKYKNKNYKICPKCSMEFVTNDNVSLIINREIDNFWYQLLNIYNNKYDNAMQIMHLLYNNINCSQSLDSYNDVKNGDIYTKLNFINKQIAILYDNINSKINNNVIFIKYAIDNYININDEQTKKNLYAWGNNKLLFSQIMYDSNKNRCMCEHCVLLRQKYTTPTFVLKSDMETEYPLFKKCKEITNYYTAKETFMSYYHKNIILTQEDIENEYPILILYPHWTKCLKKENFYPNTNVYLLRGNTDIIYHEIEELVDFFKFCEMFKKLGSVGTGITSKKIADTLFIR